MPIFVHNSTCYVRESFEKTWEPIHAFTNSVRHIWRANKHTEAANTTSAQRTRNRNICALCVNQYTRSVVKLIQGNISTISLISLKQFLLL